MGLKTSPHGSRQGMLGAQTQESSDLLAQPIPCLLTAVIEPMKAIQRCHGQMDGRSAGPIFHSQTHITHLKCARRLPILDSSKMAEEKHAIKKHRVIGHCDSGFTSIHPFTTIETETTNRAPCAD